MSYFDGMGDTTTLISIGCALAALLGAVSRYRAMRDSLISAAWESDLMRQKMSAAIDSHPGLQYLRGRVQELSRKLNPGSESDPNLERPYESR